MGFLSEKRTVIAAIFVFVLVVSAIPITYLLFRSKTPDSLSHAELSDQDDSNNQMQTELFNKFTDYLRSNHGNLVEAKAVKTKDTDDVNRDYKALVFVHRYQFIDDSLIVKLIRNFCKTEGIEYKIKKFTYKDKKLNKPDTFEVMFFNKSLPWISVRLEWQDESLYQTRKHIQYTESAEQTAIDREDVEADAQISGRARLAIVIDDIGNNIDVFSDLLSLKYDITFAVLPQLTLSREAAEMAKQAGHDVMLHLPMQPKEWPKYNPGDGALFITDSEADIQQKMAINLQSVPYVIGVNNHMGSAYTQHQEGLEVLMKVLRERGLFFMDSKTAPGNTARLAARKNNVRYLSRNIFLDNLQEEEYVKAQLFKAAAIARRNGRAIAIGHPYPVTSQVLSIHLPTLKEEGVEIVPVSKLIFD